MLPTSISSASGCSSATASAVAIQLAAATSHGRARAASTETRSPAVVKTRASPNTASTASSTNATPSRFVRNASDSSAVMVIATASAVPNSRSTAASPSGSRQTSNGRDTVRRDPPSIHAAFVFAPPMSTASVAGMRVVGVIDLKAGEAVHAVRGERERYRPLGDPLALARRFGREELYVADLDAITGGRVQTEIIAALASEARVMVDAGVSDPQRLLDLGVDRVVVGTETLTDADALLPDAVLSVDLRDGRTLSRDPRLAGLPALDALALLHRRRARSSCSI